MFPSGVKSWCYLYRSPLNRTWTRLTLGQYPALSVKAARKQASIAAAQVAEKSDPAAEKKSQRRALDIARRHTVENVVAEFKDVVAAALFAPNGATRWSASSTGKSCHAGSAS